MKENKEKKVEYNFGLIAFDAVKVPTVKETYGKEWITYSEPGFALNLIDFKNNSPLHNRIINSKVQQIIGAGFNLDKEKDKKTLEFLNRCNKYETFKQVFTKCVQDYILFGAFLINLVKTKGGTYQLYHVPFQKVQFGKKNKEGQFEKYYISDDWSKYRMPEFTPIEIPAFNYEEKQANSIICVQDYNAGSDLPLPSYIGGLTAIQTNIAINEFHLNNINNGMTLSMIINFNNGIPATEEEGKKIERKLNAKFAGGKRAGKLLVNYSTDKEHAPTFQTITPSDLDKQFIQLQNSVLEAILVSHGITSPMLVGIKTESQLGGASELMNSFQIYDSTVIKPIRETLQDFLNVIVSLNSLKKIDINSTSPVEFTWSEDILKVIMTVDELREKIGMGPFPVEETKQKEETQIKLEYVK